MRSDGSAATLLYATPEQKTPVLLIVFIEPNSEPIKGWLKPHGGARRSFAGWLELTARLRDAQAQAVEVVGGETLEPTHGRESAP
jgi:hypothetical protein